MRGVTAIVSAARAQTGRWSDSTFIDERHERLLVGQLFAHPERLPELRVGEEVFHSSRLTLFRIMRRRADTGLPWDLESLAPDLRAVGLLGFAFDLAEEWWEYPLPLRKLERHVRERWLRRRLNILGEQLLEAARDARLPIDNITATAAEVRAALGAITGA